MISKNTNNGYAIMGIGLVIGTSFNISGIIHYGKAGKSIENKELY